MARVLSLTSIFFLEQLLSFCTFTSPPVSTLIPYFCLIHNLDFFTTATISVVLVYATFLIASIRKCVQQKVTQFIRLLDFIFPICVLFHHHKHQCVRETTTQQQQRKRVKILLHKSKKTLLPTERQNVHISPQQTFAYTHKYKFKIWIPHTWDFAHLTSTNNSSHQTGLDPVKIPAMFFFSFQNFQHHSNWCDCATTKRKISVCDCIQHEHTRER